MHGIALRPGMIKALRMRSISPVSHSPSARSTVLMPEANYYAEGYLVDISSVDSRRPSLFLATLSESRDYLPQLRWLILMCLTVFGLVTLWQLNMIQAM